MRLFLALTLPAPVREAIAARMAAEQRRLPDTRWVRPEGLHLTLVFLGETAEDRLPGLRQALVEACAASPGFTLAVVGAGTFPPQRPARVAWLGVRSGRGEDADLYALMGLQRRVEKAVCAAVDQEPDRRPFHPHLTLGRPRSPWPRPVVERFLAAFDGEYGEPFAVRHVHLVRSHLEPGGARYETMAEVPLAEEEKGV